MGGGIRRWMVKREEGRGGAGECAEDDEDEGGLAWQV